MTKDKTVTMSRELAQWAFDSVDECIMRSEPSKLGELRAILAAPVVERQPDECTSCDGSGEYIDANLASLLIVLGQAGIKVSGGTHGDPWTVSSPPAPVALMLPERKNERPFGGATTAAEYNEAKGFNRAIDKVKELNR